MTYFDSLHVWRCGILVSSTAAPTGLSLKRPYAMSTNVSSGVSHPTSYLQIYCSCKICTPSRYAGSPSSRWRYVRTIWRPYPALPDGLLDFASLAILKYISFFVSFFFSISLRDKHIGKRQPIFPTFFQSPYGIKVLERPTLPLLRGPWIMFQSPYGIKVLERYVLQTLAVTDLFFKVPRTFFFGASKLPLSEEVRTSSLTICMLAYLQKAKQTLIRAYYWGWFISP